MSTISASPNYTEASSQHPCPICGKPDYCSIKNDRSRVCCRRSSDSSADSSFEFVAQKNDRNGDPYYDWQIPKNRKQIPEAKYHHEQWNGDPAPPEVTNRVYQKILKQLNVPIAFGRDRGISSHDVIKRQYGINDQLRARGVQAAIDAGLEVFFPSIPGLYIKEKDGKRYWSLKGKSGILIPVRNPKGQITALKIRVDDGGAKYQYITSTSIKWIDGDGQKQSGPGPGSQIHFPLFEGDRSTIRITEGELKADIATTQSGIWTISIPGVGSWRRAIAAVKDLGAKTVLIAHDADFRTNRAVSESLVRLLRGLLDLGTCEVILERWPIESGKGIDDVLVAGKADSIERLTGPDLSLFISELAGKTGGIIAEGDDRPTLSITTEEDKFNREVISYLRNDGTIFQRRGTLVHIIRNYVNGNGDESESSGIICPNDAPQIAILPDAKLRSRITSVVRIQTVKETKDGEETVNAHPPEWCVRAITNYGEYPGIKSLEGVIETPTLRPDGSILDQPGYDPKTRLVFESREAFPRSPSNRQRSTFNRQSSYSST